MFLLIFTIKEKVVAVKVIKKEPAKYAVKEVVCMSCGATLEYPRMMF